MMGSNMNLGLMSVVYMVFHFVEKITGSQKISHEAENFFDFSSKIQYWNIYTLYNL